MTAKNKKGKFVKIIGRPDGACVVRVAEPFVEKLKAMLWLETLSIRG